MSSPSNLFDVPGWDLGNLIVSEPKNNNNKQNQNQNRRKRKSKKEKGLHPYPSNKKKNKKIKLNDQEPNIKKTKLNDNTLQRVKQFKVKNKRKNELRNSNQTRNDSTNVSNVSDSGDAAGNANNANISVIVDKAITVYLFFMI